MQCVRKQPKRSKSQELLHQQQSERATSVNLSLLGMDGDPDLNFLLNGAELVKVRSGSWRKARFYKLQEDCKTVWHESKKTLRPKHTFSIEDVVCVRTGRQTEGLRKYTEESLESRAFSILFKGHHKNLDLIANTVEEAKHWVSGLEKIISNMSKLSQQQRTEHWIFNCLRKADINCDTKMSPEEVKRFLHDINVEVDNEYLKLLFEKCDQSKTGLLEGKEIKLFYEILTDREEIGVIYETYAKTEGLMSAADLLDFLVKEQREKVDLTHAAQLIEKYEVDETAKAKQLMTKDGFLMFLNQPDALIVSPARKSVYQDMTQPLSHYFISSSHNTYLLKDQLKGPSSTEGYVRALMKGCRCVELDIWDGSDGEPVIYHGYTLTSKILFKDTIQAIKEYAFKTSEYPVILSLENHCSVDQQKLMAEHMISILGSALITKPLGEHMPTALPSPEELKGRFLIKGKCLNKLEDYFSDQRATEDEEGSVTEEEDSRDDEEEDHPENDKKSKTLKLAKELSDLVIYCKSIKFQGFERARTQQSFYEMASFKEWDALNLAEKSVTEYIRYNVDKLSRVYPSGAVRTNSSNFDPVPLWNAGCQIVALNVQTRCAEMDLNQGLFSQNGQSGYVLKPAYLRDKESEFDPITLVRGPWLKHIEFHVMVISAQQLPKVSEKSLSVVDPLVRVEIHGVPADTAKRETKHVQNNGFNPMWNENFQFDLYVPELALVRFVAEDYDTVSSNDFIGQCTVPFASLQTGYRHVPLYDQNGDLLPSAQLFVHLMAVEAE
ncbi:1-phosphatidylinositol 4,5-bisphosphate phosphodiesterase delta-1b isoform X1 [Ictalurus furcatus]|uniref:1-phosphatidylinositol 4,5-bisphosphate phosphodiesterase delta-1b isoform X1 n=1 Tax=Ictalurus furcatus TaxID=66913 RepID=UPI002350E7BF|nr:1-phosphatidylinositol 4,5-bisphosphate phosphodiesterase delta-1b isoform X1 [Ictalurus furcatus]